VVTVHEPLVSFLTSDRAEELVRSGLFADDLTGIRAAEQRLRQQWDATVERARRLEASCLDERVADEWSFIETLRHLVFVHDVWVAEVIQEAPAPHHPWGVPPDFLPPDAVDAMGISRDARPTLDEVEVLRADRAARFDALLAGLVPGDLARTCAPRDGRFQVVGALQVVLFETWAHHQYATRDLAILERPG
jgi:hypothetical protein